MTPEEKQTILNRARTFFIDRIAVPLNENTISCGTLDAFNVNPFLIRYLAQFAFGNTEPESLAKALIYPRCLGTSPATTFGTQIQHFCHEVLPNYASGIPGFDIEFTDSVDGRRKYCQMKAGPSTINRDDVRTIEDHFLNLRRIARANNLQVIDNDCVVGVIYGSQADINGNYRIINETYPVYAGRDFWYHLTGDTDFYRDLI